MAKGYIASMPKPAKHLPPEFRDLVLRRTLPFIEQRGSRYSLEHLMGEAYLQGMRDAVAVMTPDC